jgi:DNA-binding CsgD family transcriptional regulator
MLIDANEAMARVLSTPREKLPGMSYMDFIPPEDHDDANAAWERLNAAGQFLGKRRVVTGSGALVEMNYSIVTVDVPDHGPAYLVVTIDSQGDDDNPPPPEATAALTPREHEVVALVALGHTGAEIAERLGLSPETVRTHVRHAMAKTSSHTRAQLVAVAVAKRLIGAAPEAQ